ncbi:DUF3572 domain-containing protein [uncultured Sphingorhabdus sp.]|uniref:DUF3572 domain-containing protein n=1 Tax=uncultured Sphingorhabdus sp. TaxID=1686106 RepID=UPI002615B5F0|nr:DUF3572 domain-containing protein [uncultured Sphingorhabdus sp.]
MSPKRLATAREAAETVAIQALGHIAADPQQLGRFLAETGLGPETLRAAAGDPKFLGAVLNFVLNDPALLENFAAGAELTPAAVAAAHEVLSGTNWERDIP